MEGEKQNEELSPEKSPEVTKEEYESEAGPTTFLQKQAGIWKVEAAASVSFRTCPVVV